MKGLVLLLYTAYANNFELVFQNVVKESTPWALAYKVRSEDAFKNNLKFQECVQKVDSKCVEEILRNNLGSWYDSEANAFKTKANETNKQGQIQFVVMSVLVGEMLQTNNIDSIIELYSDAENFESCLYDFDAQCLERNCIRINAETKCKSLYETFSRDDQMVVSAIENAYDTHVKKNESTLNSYFQGYVNGSIAYAIYDAVKSNLLVLQKKWW